MNKPSKISTVQDELDAMDALKHANLNAALIAAQAELPAPKKDREVEVFSRRTNSKYKFSYATMAGMMERDKPILAKHGLGFVQFANDGSMVTRILHTSGESLDCPIPMPRLPDAPQEAGSLLTYFKRYSYCAAFGRVADEEDDANIAEGNEYTPRDKARPTTGETPPNKRVKLDGPYSCPSTLKAAAKAFDNTLRNISDMGELIAWEKTTDYTEFVEQCQRDMPEWWETGEGMPAEFVPLVIRVANKRRELEELETVRG